MPDKAAVLAAIAERLKGLTWMIDSGMAVEVYTNGRRVANDIDIVVLEKDIGEAARKLGTTVTRRSADKSGLKIIDEKYASAAIGGVAIELVCGSGRYMINGRERGFNITENHFACAKKVSYLGAELNVAPREELLVHKTILGREKDVKDVGLLLESSAPDEKLLELFLNVYQLDEEERKAVLSKIVQRGTNVYKLTSA